jgi:hypothetical protein
MQQLEADFDLLRGASIGCPHYLATRLLIARLNADGIANLEIAIQGAKHRASGANVVSAGMLGKGMTIGSHAPHTHVEIDWDARFRLG